MDVKWGAIVMLDKPFQPGIFPAAVYMQRSWRCGYSGWTPTRFFDEDRKLVFLSTSRGYRHP